MCDSCYSDSSSESDSDEYEGYGACFGRNCERGGDSCSGGSCDRRSRGGNPGACAGGACGLSSGGGALPFDSSAIQDIILKLSDAFDLRVNMGEVTKAVAITSGLALAGSLIGKTFIGGNLGAAIGGVVGGACGVGVTLVSLRDIWEDVWWTLSELFDLTYDFIGALGFKDYQAAASFLMQDKSKAAYLAQMIAAAASSQLGKEVISSVLSR